MATPRKYLVDPNVPLFYHLVSRCVQSTTLCGIDPITGKDCSHRKQWLFDRLNFLVQYFAVDLYGYAIMDNHFHLALYHNPKAHLLWSASQVADRWLAISPPRAWKDNEVTPEMVAAAKQALIDDDARLLHVRKQLGSMSTFMKFLKQGIARRANLERGTAGHFFEQRFWSGALVSERAILSCMAYIDLNPVRALIVRTVEDIRHAGIRDRLLTAEADPASLEEYLQPLRCGLPETPPRLGMTLREYVEVLRGQAQPVDSGSRTDTDEQWRKDLASFRHRQRAYGSREDIERFAKERAWKRLPKPMSG
jgi:hypothetical protein